MPDLEYYLLPVGYIRPFCTLIVNFAAGCVQQLIYNQTCYANQKEF